MPCFIEQDTRVGLFSVLSGDNVSRTFVGLVEEKITMLVAIYDRLQSWRIFFFCILTTVFVIFYDVPCCWCFRNELCFVDGGAYEVKVLFA